MLEFFEQYYLWIKALHIVSIMSWMAGLLYLPRIFVYHCKAEKGSHLSETFKIMERKLLRFIMNPAMIISLVSGVLLYFGITATISIEYWVYIKSFCLLGLIAVHMWMAKWRRDFENDINGHSERFFRVINEVPTILMILIVFMVVVKPI